MCVCDGSFGLAVRINTYLSQRALQCSKQQPLHPYCCQHCHFALPSACSPGRAGSLPRSPSPHPLPHVRPSFTGGLCTSARLQGGRRTLGSKSSAFCNVPLRQATGTFSIKKAGRGRAKKGGLQCLAAAMSCPLSPCCRIGDSPLFGLPLSLCACVYMCVCMWQNETGCDTCLISIYVKWVRAANGHGH